MFFNLKIRRKTKEYIRLLKLDDKIRKEVDEYVDVGQAETVD